MNTEDNHFDLIVIGAGSGGIATAKRAAEHGAKVAIIEFDAPGGTCVNRGCVPKKIMWYAAGLRDGFALAADYGFKLSTPSFDWSELVQRREAFIDRLNGIYTDSLQNLGVTMFKGVGRLVSATQVRVGEVELNAPRIVLAPGAEAVVPAIPGAELGGTSDDFFAMTEQPKRVAVVGAGYIAVELAGVLHSLGSETDLIFRRQSVLRSFDSEMVAHWQSLNTDHGPNLIPNTSPKALEQSGDGILFHCEDGRTLGPYDDVIWAIGRSPLTETLDLEAAGVRTDAQGFIEIDHQQRSNIESIYALGDVTGQAQLTPVAIAQGRALADRLYGQQPPRDIDYEGIPTVVFSHPPLATVGLSEEAAKQRFPGEIKCYRSQFNPLIYATSEHKVASLMKIVVQGEAQNVVGMHAIGDAADEIIQGFAVALKMGATKADLDDTMAIHPTSAEEFVTMR